VEGTAPTDLRVLIHEDGLQVAGVSEVHDLHVWALKPGVTLLAVHLNLEAGKDQHAVLQQATTYCRHHPADLSPPLQHRKCRQKDLTCSISRCRTVVVAGQGWDFGRFDNM